ncbi:unnamed protein product [Rotaria magnacalcarata]|uniref:Histone-lysine N-methyltransferase, H3 lysine-79 specific n=5 Tax=Rotaria magnacalcarata TaxID=392030 RepID=A0A816WGP6_9BILA|nr:unnamed protein product [Rotaria magnacalcarata]CAF2133728.1 unnamed protein product [Rotaria magnacalcarata]CAF3831368.1 unnamed protein product [Rotaria magnacalcarata]CAF4227642.1 unnamed protein product [Rotaria magnacalcarata]
MSTTTNNVLRELKLHSPAGVEPAVFTWPNIDRQSTKKDGVFVGGDEIVKTIRLVFEDYPELYQQNLGLSICDIHSYTNMKELCDKFNKIMDTHIKLNRGTESFSARLERRASSKLFRHILAQVYSRAVTDPDKLRAYEPFSPSVYGETSPDLIDSILKTISLTEDQTFIDLGSGVGNVVLHVAALANCKHVYGIEYEEVPAAYALAMADEFRSWMRWYGKQYSEFQLEQGDFLIHPKIDERIREADVIFVNNYVFGARVNHELKVKFMNMKDGAKIVSSREFCPEAFRLNDRTKNDLGAVMYVSKPEEFFGKVSWSDKSVQYYLHVIDHSKLALYYEKIQQVHSKGTRTNHSKSNDDDNTLSPSSNNSSSNGKNHRQMKSISNQQSQKVDENNSSQHDLKYINRKRKLSTTTPNVNGKKIYIKVLPDKNQSDYESDLSNDESANSKRVGTSSKDYHSTLNELHPTSETYGQLNKNERFNYREMTKLPNENLNICYFRDCLLEQEDHRFLNSINSYLDSFRQRLFSYFAYMKSNVYREHLKSQLDNEMELNKMLKTKVNSLENSIKVLLEDTISLLKLRTNELGIEELERPVQLITYANDISSKHKELRSKVATLEKEIAEYNYENEKLNLILQSTNGSHLSTVTHSVNDNTYSTLLATMSRQTQQQENIKQSYSPISPIPSTDKDAAFVPTEFPSYSHQIPTSSFDIVKTERKSGFTIPKKVRKTPNLNSDGSAIISPMKPIKTPDKHNGLQDVARQTLPSLSLNVSASINSLLSSKQLEPVQVHSVVSSGGQQAKQQQSSVIQSLSVKPLLNSSPSSSNTKSSNEINRTMMIQSPRKKRDFYGKSSGSSTTPPSSSSSSPTNKSHRHSTTTESSSPSKNRPSSTPACTATVRASTLPDRPVSNPPLKTSS